MNSLTFNARRARTRASLFVLVLLAPLAITGCSHSAATTASTAMPSAHATMAAAGSPVAQPAPAMPAQGTVQIRLAAWNARPAYTHSNARTEEAYRYALDHPEVLQWLPCYCGCRQMGHRSNLDCYFEPQPDGSIKFEQHASYCSICVDITLRAKGMIASGATISAVRDAIDAEFGGIGPGTDTARPVS